MKKSTQAALELSHYFDAHPNAPESDPEVIRLREIVGKPEEHRHKTEIDNDKIMELSKQGLSCGQIANELGYSKSAVSLRVRRSKVDHRHHPRTSEEIDREISILHWQGLTRTAISDRLNLDYTTVVKHYRTLELTPNPRQAKHPINITKLRRLVGKGESMLDISVEFKCSTTSVRTAIAENGMLTRYNEIRKAKRQYIMLLPDGSHREYDNLRNLQKAEHLLNYPSLKKRVADGSVMTRFDWLKQQGVKM